jgi:hypothetical protein
MSGSVRISHFSQFEHPNQCERVNNNSGFTPSMPISGNRALPKYQDL